jgi:hypothetical protein
MAELATRTGVTWDIPTAIATEHDLAKCFGDPRIAAAETPPQAQIATQWPEAER